MVIRQMRNNFLLHKLLFFLLSTSLVWGDNVDLDVDAEMTPVAEKSGSDIHGFFELTFKNDYITPRGLLVTNTGLTIQVLSGLVLDVYKNPKGVINNVSVVIGTWNDVWTQQHNPKVGVWNEFDWFAGAIFTIANDWKFTTQFLEFLSPPGNFKAEQNIEFTLTYNDERWQGPIVFNPYVKLFWAVSGDSTVVVGKRGGTYYIEFGMVPVLDLSKYCVPLVLSAPTWFSVGPAAFWNGSHLALKHENSHFGLFSTGLKGSFPLKFIPSTLGKWNFDIGAQYYHLVNNNLLQAQIFTLGLSSIKSAHRDVGVAFAGLSFNY